VTGLIRDTAVTEATGRLKLRSRIVSDASAQSRRIHAVAGSRPGIASGAALDVGTYSPSRSSRSRTTARFITEQERMGSMQDLADSYAFWIFAFTALAVVYMLPTLIGAIRRVDRLALVFLVNLIGAPAGVGWFAAMILAFGPRRLPPRPPLPVQPAAMPPDARMHGWQDPR
jgi:hypothetical protein